MTERRLPTRREFLALGAGAFAVAAVPWARSDGARLTRGTVPVMGTTAELAVVHRDARYARLAIDAATAELQRIEAAMTRFSPASDVGRANRGASSGGVRISPATACVLGAALDLAARTDGRFDPGLARLTELWDSPAGGVPPPAAEVRRLAGGGLYCRIDLGRSAGVDLVRFAAPDVVLDLGGIAKGYGVDRAVAVLREWGVRDGFVNVGGDLYALGESEAGRPWRVGVRSAKDPRGLDRTVELTDAAVATSGDYERFFEHGGRRYPHIIDAATGEPRRGASRTVTVRAASCMEGDAAATACFGLDRPAAERLLTRAVPGASIVHLS